MDIGVGDWAEIDKFEYQWRRREDEHREQMGFAARAFADATYGIRRHAEAMMEPLIRSEALVSRPPALNGKAIHHIDGNPLNNEITSLQIVSLIERSR